MEHKSPYLEGIINRNDNRTHFVTQKIVNGEYELIESNVNQNSFRYETPLMDIEKFKNTEILVSDGEFVDIGLGFKYGLRMNNSIYLQLIITLKQTGPSADQTPIIHNVTYNLKNFTNTWNSNTTKENALILKKILVNS